ncbi:hypothetical protein L249_6531 [Ophiocordyceps polyrhachis-furcata BCC 54312]|uniref:Uncharacterized protein n=1 Tax=Ophiocordyceps polyrhachis-furcata BCC 54312 TaxID=1330021 RepID=A0A367LKC1_9HYPO|nr:hypothetical protein L249_6531 [Ophiocordyceps polyrhachis-furcata BCC 54312]
MLSTKTWHLRLDSLDRYDTLFPASHNGSNYYRNVKYLYSVKDENRMPLLLEEKDAFYNITNALYSNAALIRYIPSAFNILADLLSRLLLKAAPEKAPAERLGLEPNTENYKVDRILNIRKIKRGKGIARTEYLIEKIALEAIEKETTTSNAPLLFGRALARRSTISAPTLTLVLSTPERRRPAVTPATATLSH